MFLSIHCCLYIVAILKKLSISNIYTRSFKNWFLINSQLQFSYHFVETNIFRTLFSVVSICVVPAYGRKTFGKTFLLDTFYLTGKQVVSLYFEFWHFVYGCISIKSKEIKVMLKIEVSCFVGLHLNQWTVIVF